MAGYAQTMGRDVEHFAKHAKRTVGRLFSPHAPYPASTPRSNVRLSHLPRSQRRCGCVSERGRCAAGGAAERVAGPSQAAAAELSPSPLLPSQASTDVVARPLRLLRPPRWRRSNRGSASGQSPASTHQRQRGHCPRLRLTLPAPPPCAARLQGEEEGQVDEEEEGSGGQRRGSGGRRRREQRKAGRAGQSTGAVSGQAVRPRVQRGCSPALCS